MKRRGSSDGLTSSSYLCLGWLMLVSLVCPIKLTFFFFSLFLDSDRSSPDFGVDSSWRVQWGNHVVWSNAKIKFFYFDFVLFFEFCIDLDKTPKE